MLAATRRASAASAFAQADARRGRARGRPGAGTLGQRYGSKRGLLLAALRERSVGVRAAFAVAAPPHASRSRALHAALVGSAGPVGAREAFANHLGVLALDVADPEFRRIAERWFERAREQLAGAAHRRGRGRGAAHRRRPGRARARHPGAYNGALGLWAVTGTGSLADTLRADVGAVLSPWR